ncbi:MAG: hypothetical protein LM583_04595 [Desulfurococcaceae archaeon]|nr:hypothetical protein [Desulfurococcaceae archaeon]
MEAYPWEEKRIDIDVYLSDTATLTGSRTLNIARTVKVASMNISISKPSIDIEKLRYDWSTTLIELKPTVESCRWSIGKPDIDIDEVQRLLKSNPGEVWLEKLILRYIHDRIEQFIASNNAMSQYFDAFMWLSQMPIGMVSYTPHNITTLILDALCSKCCSEAERVKILCNVTGYSLNASIRSIGLYYSTYNETLANATVRIAKISSYPELWEPYNTSINNFYALPAGNGYRVFYNVYENSPFGNWLRARE